MMYDELVKRLRIGTKDFPGYIVYPDGGVQPFYLTSKDLEQAADAIEGLELRCKNFEEALNELDEKLDKVEQKKGKWVLKTLDDGNGEFQIYECDQCGAYTAQQRNFCYNCGADMRGDSDV